MRALVLALLLACAGPAAAEPRIGIRVGEHPEHGRVVLDWPTAPEYVATTVAGTVQLRFPGTAEFDLGAVRRPPRNVASIEPVAGGVDIVLRPGARARVYRLGARIVVDAFAGPAPGVAPAAVLDAVTAGATAAGPAAGPPPPRPRDVRAAAPSRNAGGAGGPATIPTVAQASGAEPPQPVAPATPPPVADATPLPLPSALPPPAAIAAQIPALSAVPLRVRALAGQPRGIPLPFPPGTAAAVLRRADAVLVAFDHPLPLDLTPLRRDPVFAALETQTMPGGTLLRLPVVTPGGLRLRRDNATWVLEASQGEDPRDGGASRPILPATGPAAPTEITLPAAGPGSVLALTDPLTGLPLLIGPVREAGQPVTASRRLGEFDLLETVLGVAVLARSDAVTLRPAADRFLLGGASGVALDASAFIADAAAMTRSFDLPTLPIGQLAERLRSQRIGIAEAPPLARYPLRIGAAQTLLALGLPQEAQAMLALAAGEDPRGATDPQAMALGGIAGLLAGRLAEATGLDATPLPASDELTLWRGLLAASRGDSAAAAPNLAATLPLLLGYPETLRERLLPIAAETLAEAGAAAPLKRLLGALPDDAQPLPRGMLAEAAGAVEPALAAYAAAADGRDRRARARALRRAAELRLAQHLLDDAGAAKALDATLFAWRDETEELATRLRIAALRRGTDGRGALALLRETEALFPEQAARLFTPMQAAFVAALAQEPPLSAIALHDAYPELLPADATGEAAVSKLAEAMAALDLPDRGAALLRGAAERATTANGRATLGERWAALLLETGDTAGAEAALGVTAASDLPAALRHERGLLAARIQARAGDFAAATATLRGLGPNGLLALSELLAERGEWPAAANEHANYLRSLPLEATPLAAETARAVVRQAALLALAGDEPAIGTLAARLRGRLPAGTLADAFAALTAPQLRGLADLPRLQRDLALFRAWPARLEALRAGAAVTR